MNAKKSIRKIGIVSVKEFRTPKKGDRVWALRYVDPTTHLEVRRRVSESWTKVKEIADELTKLAHQGKGYLAARKAIPTIEEGITLALSLTRTLESVRRERARNGVKFLQWLAQNYPVVQRWDQLRQEHVQAYVNQLEQRGLAHDSVRLAIAPIKLAWRSMAENYPEVRPLPRIRQAPQPMKDIQCLEPREVAMLLDWLRKHEPDLWAMASLQALCGLRMLEAASLRVQDVNLEVQTITITDTGHHKPKTRASWRTLPLCQEAIEALRLAMAQQKVKPSTGEIFVNQRGNLWVKNALTLRWRRVLREAALALECPRLKQVPARKLRAAFATMANRLEIPDRALKAYLGHSAGDVLGTHYCRIDASALRAASGRFARWRTLITPHDSRKHSGYIGVEAAFCET